MATFNGEKFIVQQLQSILNQSGVDVDIIIYDEGSSDRTIEIIRDFKTKNPNIKIELNINSTPTGSAAVNFLNGLSDLNQKKKTFNFRFKDTNHRQRGRPTKKNEKKERKQKDMF